MLGLHACTTMLYACASMLYACITMPSYINAILSLLLLLLWCCVLNQGLSCPEQVTYHWTILPAPQMQYFEILLAMNVRSTIIVQLCPAQGMARFEDKLLILTTQGYTYCGLLLAGLRGNFPRPTEFSSICLWVKP